jgi:NAD+ synthase
MVGLFVKYGVDDNADLMPLKNLYRSQILSIARHIGVPEAIWSRSPNPEMIPGVTDKYRDILGLPSETIDLILYHLERNAPPDEIGRLTGLECGKVEEIRLLVAGTEHMRAHSMGPDL